ncbi:MAG: SurA N-terminal domain-containing protein [Sphingomonadales bacterium]|nr:SurA N-terminal domain-containing protein [Sphingomonadales bacterium]
MRSHGKSTVVWVLLAMLILGLGGFGVTSFSGGNAAIGAVGDTEISVNDYARALRSEMNAASAQLGQPVGMAEARAMGLDRQVQGQIFGEAAISEQARRLGLSVGDAEITRQIQSARAFQGLNGQFDRETYRQALRNEGYTEATFETQLRADVARSILQTAVVGGVTAPATLTEAYAAFLTESRDLELAEVTEADLSAAIPEPTEDALKAWHQEHAAEFTAPETREITYVWLTPLMLRDKVQVDEAALQAAYDARRDEFVQPERRMVEELVYPSAEEAAAAKAKYDAGEASFADLAAARGLSLEDIDMGEVTRDRLGPAADAVFALEEPGVVGPIESALGPALYAMNAILPGQEVTLEEARDELVGEAEMARARKMIGDQTADLEDRLAGGATLEQMAEETEMELGTLSFGPGTDAGIAGYEAFRAAAAAVTEEDFPELGNLDDGGVFALRLDGITPAALKPFDTVRDQVAASWRAAQLTTLKSERAAEIVAAVAGGATLASAGVLVESHGAVPRTGFLPGVPQGLLPKAFETEPGKAAVVTEGGRVFVLSVTRVIAGDPASDEAAQVRSAAGRQIGQSMANDLIALYATAAQAEAGLTIDTAAINAVQAQLQ